MKNVAMILINSKLFTLARRQIREKEARIAHRISPRDLLRS